MGAGTDLTYAVESVEDREQLGVLLTDVRGGRPVRDLASSVQRRVGERNAVSFSTVSSWCRGDTAPNPRQFRAFAALLLECGVDDPGPWLRAVQRIRGADSAGPSPYPGLQPFTANDATAFRGREAVLDELLACFTRIAERHTDDRSLVLVGASGSGKTSLIQAGLVPRLTGDGWQLAVAEAGEVTSLPPADVGGGRSVLVVDRLEQVLRPEIDDALRQEFLATVAEFARSGVVVMALRADFYDAALQHPLLLHALRTAQVVVGQMSSAELREAIEGPARAAGSAVPRHLTDLVLAEAGVNGDDRQPAPGLLPHLSHALRRTWEHGRRGRMGVEDFRAVGGVVGAIEQTAEEAYNELPAKAQTAARALFLHMVHVSEGGPLTRRAALRAEVADITRRSGARGVDVVEHFIVARLLTAGGAHVEIAHEALLLAWSRLHGWVEEARDALRTHSRLRDATATWVQGHRKESDLVRGTALSAYRELAERALVALTAEERSFVEASVAGARREELRQREQRSRQIAFTARNLTHQNPSVAARLAVAALETAPTVEARSAVLDLGSRPLPQRILGEPGDRAVALSRHGDLLATSDPVAGTVQLLVRGDDSQYRPAGQIALHAKVRALVLALDSPLLLAGGDDGETTLWDVADPSRPTRVGAALTGPRGPIRSIAITADGTEVAVAGEDGRGVHRWDLADPLSPRPLSTLPVASRVVWDVAYRPDGRAVAATDDHGMVRLFVRGDDAVTEVGQIELGQNRARALTFSPDGSLLAVGTVFNNLFRVWDVANLSAPTKVADAEVMATSWINDVVFSSDGKYAAAASSDTTVKLWSTATWAEKVELPHSALVLQLCFARDGTLATVATDGTTRVWSVPADLPVTAPSAVFNVSTSAATGTVAAVGRGQLQLFGPGPDGPVASSNVTKIEGATAVGGGTISQDGTLVSQGHQRGYLELHRLDTTPRRTVVVMDQPDFGAVRDVSFSADSQLLAAVGDVELRICDVSDRRHPRPTAVITQSSQPRTLAWHPSDRLLAVTYDSGVARLYDATDPHEPVLTSSLSDATSELFALAFHPAGDVLAVGGNEATLELWDITDPWSPRLLGEPLVGPSARIQWAAFSPDGSRLVATSNDGTAWLWDTSDVVNPVEFATLGPAPAALVGVTFDRDGHHILAGGLDARLHVWSVDVDAVVHRIRHELGAPLTRAEWSTHLRGAEFELPS